jgi:hypothetical protein
VAANLSPNKKKANTNVPIGPVELIIAAEPAPIRCIPAFIKNEGSTVEKIAMILNTGRQLKQIAAMPDDEMQSRYKASNCHGISGEAHCANTPY